AESGEILRVSGIREKTRANILRGIALWKAGRARTPFPRARAVAARVTEALAARGGADQIEVAGSLRRMRETVKDIDILVTSTEPQRVIKTFVTLPSVLGIEAARAERLPALVTRAAIRGDLHTHTDWSDGHHPLEQLIEAAQARGHEYVVVSDHSKSATVARGLGADALLAQIAKIRELQPRYRIRILAGSECDVLADGTLDFPDEILRELDVVLAAVHSRFTQPRHEMTTRLVRALANPYVNVLAHPTGRLIGAREPYDVDLAAALEAARAHGKAGETHPAPGRRP